VNQNGEGLSLMGEGEFEVRTRFLHSQYVICPKVPGLYAYMGMDNGQAKVIIETICCSCTNSQTWFCICTRQV